MMEMLRKDTLVRGMGDGVRFGLPGISGKFCEHQRSSCIPILLAAAWNKCHNIG